MRSLNVCNFLCSYVPSIGNVILKRFRTKNIRFNDKWSIFVGNSLISLKMTNENKCNNYKYCAFELIVTIYYVTANKNFINISYSVLHFGLDTLCHRIKVLLHFQSQNPSRIFMKICSYILFHWLRSIVEVSYL